MTEEKKLELIEAYHRGLLSDIEKTQFESLLANDPEFASELEDYNSIFNGFDMMHMEAFSAQLDGFEKKHHPAAAQSLTSELFPKPKTYKIKRYIAVAAIIAALAFIPFALQFYLGASDADVYTALYETPMAITASVRGGEDKGPDTKEAALTLFNEKKFDQAITKLSEIVSVQDKNYEARFYLAVSYMEKADFASAKMHFEKISASDNGYYGQASIWYGLLCDHKTGNLKAAAEAAKTIAADPNHNFYANAKEYLKLTE